MSSDIKTSSTVSYTEAKPDPFLIYVASYLILYDLPLGVLLVVVPALAVTVILNSRKLREINAMSYVIFSLPM